MAELAVNFKMDMENMVSDLALSWRKERISYANAREKERKEENVQSEIEKKEFRKEIE